MGLVTIRLTKSESEKLTALRATRELRTLIRSSIRDCLYSIIADAGHRNESGVIQLPVQRTVPAISRGEFFEQISLKVDSATQRVLRSLAFGTEYGPADVVRELIIIYFDGHVSKSKELSNSKSRSK